MGAGRAAKLPSPIPLRSLQEADMGLQMAPDGKPYWVPDMQPLPQLPNIPGGAGIGARQNAPLGLGPTAGAAMAAPAIAPGPVPQQVIVTPEFLWRTQENMRAMYPQENGVSLNPAHAKLIPAQAGGSQPG